MRLTPGHEGDTRRRTGRLRIHARQTHPLIGQRIDVGCLVAANRVELGDSHIAEPHVVDENIENVRRLATVLGPEVRQLVVHTLLAKSKNTLVALLADACTPLDESGPAMRGAGFDALTKAEEFLAAHLESPISLPEVAAAAGANVRTLSRVFRKEHGIGPMSFWRRRRLDAARRSLENGPSWRDYRYGCGLPFRVRASRTLRRRIPKGLRRIPFGNPAPTKREVRQRRTARPHRAGRPRLTRVYSPTPQ